MTSNSAVMIVPNTKDGLNILKYLASELVKQDVFIKLVTKKEFDRIVKLDTKGDSK